MIERGIGKWQRTGVTYPEIQARVAVLALRMVDIGGRKIQPFHAGNPGILCKAEAQTAGTASDVKDAARGHNSAKHDEQWCETAAPSSHLQFVTITIPGYECR